MTRKERLERLRQTLLEQRDLLRQSLTGEVGGSAGFEATHGDEGDAATSFTADELDSRLVSHRSDELVEINYALEKFKQGRYGICEMTSAPIPIARLEALPFTRYTIEAQRMIEEKGIDPDDYDRDGRWARAIEHERRLGDRTSSLKELLRED